MNKLKDFYVEHIQAFKDEATGKKRSEVFCLNDPRCCPDCLNIHCDKSFIVRKEKQDKREHPNLN